MEEGRARRSAVICVDDDRAGAITNLLARASVDVVATTARGLDVIPLVADRTPDLALVDIARVGGLGLRLFTVLAIVAPDCRTIAINRVDGLEAALLDAGADDVVDHRDLRGLRRILEQPVTAPGETVAT